MLRPLALLLFFAFFETKISAAVWRVASGQSIAAAVEKASAGDTVFVEKGIFREKEIKISKKLTLIGLDRPVVDAAGEGEIFILGADGCELRGFEMRSTGRSSLDDRAGVRVVGVRGVLVADCRFEDCLFGIYFANSTACIALRNEVRGTAAEEFSNGNAIHAWKCDSLRIEGNFARSHRDGIYFEFVTNSLIINNLCEANARYGLHFMFSHSDVYRENTFRKNGAGVAVMYSHKVEMTSNFFEKSLGAAAYGLLLKDISDSQIERNHFTENTVAVYLEGANRNRFSRNVFSQNGWAVRVQASCEANDFFENDFLQNTFDVATNGSLVLSRFDRNFWDKYDGYDLEGDGTGDVPFRPVSLYGSIIERMPWAAALMRSLTVWLLDRAEKALPSLTPENLRDDRPQLRPTAMTEHG